MSSRQEVNELLRKSKQSYLFSIAEPCARQCTQNMEVCSAVKPATLHFLHHDLTGRMIKRSALIGEDTVLFQLLLDALLIGVFSDAGDHSAACNLTETQVDERMQ